MICLNDKLLINIKSMEIVLLEELDKIIEHRLYIDDLKDDQKDKIRDVIIKEFKQQIKTDLFYTELLMKIIVHINIYVPY